MNAEKIRIVIVEDELMMSGVLKAWIRRFHDLQLVGERRRRRGRLELCQSDHPDVALIDIRLPKLDGLDLIQRLVADFPKCGCWPCPA